MGRGGVRVSGRAGGRVVLRGRAGLERLGFGLAPIEGGPPGAFPSLEVALRPGSLPLWDVARVAGVVGGGTAGTVVALSPSPPGWLVVPRTPPGAPRLALETDAGLVASHAPVRRGGTLAGFGPGTATFPVASPDTWPALRAPGMPLRGALRRAALAWALQGPQLARAETDRPGLPWRGA